VEAGRKAGVEGTPAYVVGGRSFVGRVPADVMEAALGQAASR